MNFATRLRVRQHARRDAASRRAAGKRARAANRIAGISTTLATKRKPIDDFRVLRGQFAFVFFVARERV